MKEFIDWNKLTMEQYIEHLENKFMVDSSGTAKAVFELIAGYKALISPVVAKSLPTKEEMDSELEMHQKKWGKSHDNKTNDAYALGFRHCFHFISDWINFRR